MEARFIIKNNVCLNPIKEILYKDSNLFFGIELGYSEAIKKWAYGYSYEAHKFSQWGSFSAPAFNEYRETFESMETARMAAIKNALGRARGLYAQNPQSPGIQSLLKKLDELATISEQLELFA